MSFFTQSVSIPIWFLIMMNVIVVALLVKLFLLVNRYNRGEITKEEHSDMVVWTIRTKDSAKPKTTPVIPDEEKKREKKEDLVQVLKVLIKEGERGVLKQTITDRMGSNRANTQRALEVLVEKKLVEEVNGMSGTKYYLTQAGRDYCKSKAKA
ncbi:MAG: hypothetical protein GC149_14300 [Gammaproteobacteria bacterium]|nr:hypothetical protein [Gammaproteobacteria bacterium]